MSNSDSNSTPILPPRQPRTASALAFTDAEENVYHVSRDDPPEKIWDALIRYDATVRLSKF